jgi:type II secretory pathway predicted ATPase ExeA
VYEEFYGLRARPFSILPDPGYLYFSRRHKVALGLLEYGLQQSVGFSVVTGAIGTGKTTLIRYLLGRTGDHVSVGLIANLHAGFSGLLPRVLLAFGLDTTATTEVGQLQVFSRFLEEQIAQAQRTVLIIDEAQNLPIDALEELRLLSNVNADVPVLQIILAGQPGLKEKLRCAELEQLAQRVVVDYQLEALDRDDTCRYIAHRVQVAGGNAEALFNESACDAVYRCTLGVPRLINVICETALVYGFADQMPGIDAQIIEDVADDRRRGGILPIQSVGTTV